MSGRSLSIRVLERDDLPVAHVERIRASFGHLLLQLQIGEPQEVRKRARGAGWGQEMKADPSNRAT